MDEKFKYFSCNFYHSKKRDYEFCSKTADFIKSKTDMRPEILLVCGTGISAIEKLIKVKHCIEFSEIPNFPKSEVETHKNKFIFGEIARKCVVVMLGRIHFYECHGPMEPVFPIRVMSLFGIKNIIITSAVGGINDSFKVGDFVVIKDHINFPGFTGQGPLNGPNDNRFGKRFLSLKDCYSSEMRNLFMETLKSMKNTDNVRQGTYAFVSGPHFETPAEVRFLRMIGCDVVGMSVVPEAIAAAHIGIKTFALSIITNMSDDGESICFDKNTSITIFNEIEHIASARADKLFEVLSVFIEKL